MKIKRAGYSESEYFLGYDEESDSYPLYEEVYRKYLMKKDIGEF